MLSSEQWELLYRRIIDLRGTIDATAHDYVKEAMERLADNGHLDFRVMLESRGGDNYYAWKIHDLFRGHSGRITGIVPDYAFSGAVTVLQGCHLRMMAMEAKLLIHRPYRLEESTLNLAETIPEVSDDQLEKCFEELCLLYGGRSGRNPHIFRQQCLEGTLISSSHALSLGLVDQLIA